MTLALPPDVDGRWITPRGVTAVLEELELCGVPVNAPLPEARRVLALSGVWVPDGTLTGVLKVRREAAGQGRSGPLQRAA
ncbi:hypothetical protein [Micromonospora sp. NBRC 110037]|uniref:hypothetical protein n=1 Tax=Micromonospora sp. NBRC 110037 TaxID=1621261 RepID=UPI000A739100|nr:hypothetical protein [Micromonospora sp. NBRC 110037]